VHVGPVATSSGTRMISLMARRALAALVSALGWSGFMFAVGEEILQNTFKCKFAETANWKQAATLGIQTTVVEGGISSDPINHVCSLTGK